MEKSKIIIEETRFTPYILIDSAFGTLQIKGKSSPESASEFYYKVINDIHNYLTPLRRNINASFMLSYFNTSSAKCLFQLIQSLEKKRDEGYQVHVDWYYEEDDEDMLDSGEDLMELSGLSFNMIEMEYEEYVSITTNSSLIQKKDEETWVY